MNLNRKWSLGFLLSLAALAVATVPGRPAAAEADLAIDEGEAAPAAKAGGAPSSGQAAGKAASAAPAKAAPKAAARSSSIIKSVKVVPAGDRVEVRITGSGKLVPTISKDDADKKLILDFAGTRYAVKGKIILGAPGVGDVKAVRGAQNKPGLARVVVELSKPVPYTQSAKTGSFAIVFATEAVVGPDETVFLAASATPMKGAASAPPAKQAPAVTASAPELAVPPAGEAGVRSRLLHAMVTDLPDRVRLVATSDGVVRYKIASQDNGRELVLSLYDMDLKWSPPRLDFKDGPIVQVRADQVRQPLSVKMGIKLRQALPYHVRRDQNQVVVEVEKPAEAAGKGAAGPTRGDLEHKVTLNVQNEDLTSLVKGLAFEAGFENVVINSKSMANVGTVTISLREVPFAKALNLILAPNELVWKVERNVLKVGKAEAFDLELANMALSGGGGSDEGDEEGGIVTRVFHLRFISVFELSSVGSNQPPPAGQQAIGNAGTAQTMAMGSFVANAANSEVANIIKDILVDKKNGKVVIDSRTNSLVVTDASSNMRKIERIIRELDVPLPQVMIEARLVQVRVTKTRNLGVEWAAEKAQPANPTVTGEFANLPPINAWLRTGLLGPGFNLDLTLGALETTGDAKVLLNPRIATIHDRAATILAFDAVPYRTSTYVSNQGVGTWTDTIQKYVIPVSLFVRPHVNPNDTINLEVQINSAAVTGQAMAVGYFPPTTEQTAVTQLIVRNGETAVIGGLMRDNVSKNVEKVPLLGDLPWFLGGGLFRRETTQVEKVELILFLTPHTVKDI